jgi:hypothetical protein
LDATSPRSTPHATFVTGSRRLDLVLLAALAAVLLGSLPRLRVYYAVTLTEVHVVHVAPDGVRRELRTPEPFRQPRPGRMPPPALLAALEREIRAFMAGPEGRALAPGGRVDWIIRWAYNSTRLDRQETLSFEVGDAAAG